MRLHETVDALTDGDKMDTEHDNTKTMCTTINIMTEDMWDAIFPPTPP